MGSAILADAAAKQPAANSDVGMRPDLPVWITVDEDGFVRDCAPEVQQSLGYQANELRGQHLGDLVPELGRGATHDGARLQSRLTFLSRCGMPFRLRLSDGRFAAVDLFLARVGDDHDSTLAVMVRPIGSVN